MPRAKRTDNFRRTELNLSAEARALLAAVAGKWAAEEKRPVPQSEVAEKALRLLAKKLKL